jgi:HK97 family phage major capsid protein
MKDAGGSESILPYLTPVSAPATNPIGEYTTYIFEERITKMTLYAGLIRISELLLQDLPAFYDFVPTLRSIISVALSNTIDKLLADTLNGYTASDVLEYNTISGALPDPDDLAKGLDTLEARNGGNMVFIMHPNTKHYYRTLKTTDGYYRFINPITTKEFTMFGVPVIADEHVDENKVFLIDTKQTFEILHYKGLNFEAIAQGLDEASRFLKTFRFSARLGLMKRFGKIIVWEKTA